VDERAPREGVGHRDGTPTGGAICAMQDPDAADLIAHWFEQEFR
jgi:hypothetical protein